MATGAEAKIWAALVAHFKTLTLSPVLPVAYPNAVFPAPPATAKPDAYLQVNQLRAETTPIGIAAWDEHVGIFQIDYVFKAKAGIEAPTEIADRIAAHFQRNLKLGNVEINRTPAIASPIDDAPYTRIPVSVRYRAEVK